MLVKIAGKVRGILEMLDTFAVGREDEQIRLGPHGEQLMLPGTIYQENVRTGRAFWAGTTSAIAAVVAVPTTGHMLALYNTAPDGGRSMIIDWVAAQNVVSTAVASQAQLLVNVGQIREAAPTPAALTFKKRNGLGNGAGVTDTSAIAILNATALPAGTGVAANWFPLGPSAGKPGSAATPGYGLYQRVDGDIIVAPGRYFAAHVLANVVGETFVIFIGWHEKQLTLG
jgi:hypothetical protein